MTEFSILFDQTRQRYFSNKDTMLEECRDRVVDAIEKNALRGKAVITFGFNEPYEQICEELTKAGFTLDESEDHNDVNVMIAWDMPLGIKE